MADPQVTIDIGGAVSAGLSAVQAIQNLLTGSRSATIEIDNNTGLSLTLYNSTLDHGGWVKGPDPVIGPMTPTVFGSQNLGGSVMTGTQASVQYISDDSLLWLWVGWDNPYIGSNKAGASLGWANADQYMIRFIVGSGNTQAQFRFLLLPNPGSVYARIKNITQGQSFL